MGETWAVEVWFYSGPGYRAIGRGLPIDRALRVAREYAGGDARGVRLISTAGQIRQIK